MSTSSSAVAAESMMVVVDVADTANCQSGVDALIERLEIDVDVTPHTTADDLLTDVEAALTDMKCVLCVPRKVAALAAGHTLPPLTALKLEMRSAISGTTGNAGTSGGMSALTAKYVSALCHVRDASSVEGNKLCIGSERVSQAAYSIKLTSPLQEQQQQKVVVWSIVPRSFGEHAESLVAVSASTAATSAASSRMLTRNEATPQIFSALNTAATASGMGSDFGKTKVAASRSDGSAKSLLRETSLASANLYAKASPSGTGELLKETDSKRSRRHHCETQVTSAVDGAADAPAPAATKPFLPSASWLSRPSAGSASHSATSVVALEDVDVFSFRCLQAHRALVLSREEATNSCPSLLLPGGINAASSDEQQRLQPTLPYVALEAAIQTEVRRLQDEHVLMGGWAFTREEVSRADCTLSESPTSSSLGIARARLRAAWLQAVKEEAAAYKSDLAELRQATEKAEVWRAALKDTLRSEIADLETEAAQRATVLQEREVLRSRVAQLEAQVSAAREQEMALLQSARFPSEKSSEKKSAGALGEVGKVADMQTTSDPTKTEHAKEGNEHSSYAAASAAGVPASPLGVTTCCRQLQSPASPSSATSSSDTSSSDSCDPPPPPPPRSPSAAADSAHRVEVQAVPSSSRHRSSNDVQRPDCQRWSGRRVPLIHPDTSSSAVHSTKPRSRSRLSIERSFLSPSLQEEVRAALASDDDRSTTPTDTSGSTRSSSGGDDGVRCEQQNNQHHYAGRECDKLAGDEITPAPPLPFQLEASSRRRRYQRKEDVSSWTENETSAARHFSAVEPQLRPFSTSATPLRTVPTTAFSPSPVVPGMSLNEGRRYDVLGAAAPAAATAAHSVAASSLSIPSPAFSNLYDTGDQSLWMHSQATQQSSLQRRSSPSRNDANTSAVEELRSVTSALRRHIREPQPDPLEGQRLLQQVRELRREIEQGGRGNYSQGDAADGDDTKDKDGEDGPVPTWSSKKGGESGNVTFADPQGSSGRVVATSVPVSRVPARQPYMSSTQLYDSRVPSRRRGLYGH